jgi:ankyrin repeat protein
MHGKKLLGNVAVGSLLLGNYALHAKTRTISNRMTNDFWVHDLGLTPGDMAFYKKYRRAWFNANGELYWAVQSQNKPLVKRLHAEGVDMNTRLRAEQTALHHSAFASTGIMRLLLDGGANPNLRDNEGCSPLHVVAIRASGKMVELLVDYGADPNLKNKKGYTPLVQTVYAILFEMGWRRRKRRRPISVRIPRSLSPKARLYEKKNNLAPPKTGHYFPVMRSLVNCGAIPNVQDNEGNTALHLAASQPNGFLLIEYPSLKLLKELVALGVDVNIRNKNGKTVLDEVRQRKEEYNSFNETDNGQRNRYVAWLQAHDIDIHVLSEDGGMLTDLVRQKEGELRHKQEIINAKYDRIIAFLLEHGAIESQPKESSEDEEEAEGSEVEDSEN